jgi:hypothetical protein
MSLSSICNIIKFSESIDCVFSARYLMRAPLVDGDNHESLSSKGLQLRVWRCLRLLEELFLVNGTKRRCISHFIGQPKSRIVMSPPLFIV